MDAPLNITIRGWKMYTKVNTEIEIVSTARITQQIKKNPL